METLEFALTKEQGMVERYQELAKGAPKPELKEAFTLLAAEEAKHIAALKRIQVAMKGWDDSAFVAEHHKALERAVGRVAEAAVPRGVKEAYEQALACEKESETFYREAAKKETSGALKGLFYFLEGMERDHAKMLERIIGLVSRLDVFLDPGRPD